MGHGDGRHRSEVIAGAGQETARGADTVSAQAQGPEGFADYDLWVGVAAHEGVDEPKRPSATHLPRKRQCSASAVGVGSVQPDQPQ